MDGSELRVIIGPTAAGKSALAMRLAATYRGTIISADSAQVYRRFDVGTAKPSQADRAAVPHEGVDLVEPTDRFSAARFAEAAEAWIAEAERAGRTPVVVGGTGFWIAALVAPLAPMPPIAAAPRRALEAFLSTLDDATLQRWCAALDPTVATRGPAQWRRAIEVALLTGQRLSALQRQAPPRPPRAVRYLVVDPGDRLRSRIAARIDAMLVAGWMDEVAALRREVPHDAPAWRACGYERLRDAHAAGRSADTQRESLVTETWQYARRQRTWCRHQLRHGSITRLDPEAPDAWATACAWWEETRTP